MIDNAAVILAEDEKVKEVDDYNDFALLEKDILGDFEEEEGDE